MLIYKVLYKNYEVKQGELIGALAERRKDLRGKTRVESGLRWAKLVFGRMVTDKQAIFVIPHEVTSKDNTIVPVEKIAFTREEFFGTMRGAGSRVKEERWKS